MSMSRGFKIAGCKNILMTLWEVNDRASAELIESFYENLNKGIHKTQALRKAKIEYLSDNDQVHANPYYWAGYVMMGSQEKLSLQTQTSGYWWWIISGGVVLMLFIGGFYFYSKIWRKSA